MEAIHTWKVDVQLLGLGHSTSAHATLRTRRDGGALYGQGRARRNPSDADIPEIGEEIAVSRALRDLADRLVRAASEDISEVQHTTVRLRR